MSLMGNLESGTVAEIERVALGAWPGLEVEPVGGWLVRHARGVTRRANSVWPNGEFDARLFETQIARVEMYYHVRGLPARFQICPAAQPSNLDAVLDARGYQAVARTAVQTMMLGAMLQRLHDIPSFLVEITEQPSAGWWACYAEADDVALASLAGRQAICAGIAQATAYASAWQAGKVIAVGSAAAEADWMGFFNIATLPQARRRGAGRAVLAALAAWGQAQGASRAYLQVVANNATALRLYEQVGFTTGYFYHYREELLRD